jgi:hypothetical protein
MSMTEFYRWQGWLRQNPAGWGWLKLQFAELRREVAKGRVSKGKKLPELDHYMARRPEPLFSIRAKLEASKK